MNAEELKEANGGVWGNHPRYDVEDWKYRVSNGDTRLGYWEWVAVQIEMEE